MKHPLRWVALVGISVLAFTAFLDFTIVNTALPFIQVDFHSSILQLQWISNVFSIVLTTTMVAVGRFADLHGRRKTFYWGLLIFAVAAAGAGLSPSIGFLILFRGIQGLGASIVFIGSSALLTDVFPKEEHAHAAGIYGGITGLGLAIGPLIGGMLIEWLGWRWVFWINLPLIALGLICCLFCLKVSPHIKPKTVIDMKGLLLFVVGLASFVAGIISAAGEGFSSWHTLFLLIAGIVILIIFVWLEKGADHPLIHFDFFKNPLLLLNIFSVTMAGVASYVFMFFDPLYLRTVRHLPALEMGLWIAAIPAAQVAISFLFKHLLKWFGIGNLMLTSILAALLAIALHRFIGAETPLAFLLLPFAILGVNWGLSNTGLISSVNQVVAPSKAGHAIGTIATIWNMVGAILLALSSGIFHVENKISFLNAYHAMIDFNIVFALIVAAASSVLWCKLRRSR